MDKIIVFFPNITLFSKKRAGEVSCLPIYARLNYDCKQNIASKLSYGIINSKAKHLSTSHLQTYQIKHLETKTFLSFNFKKNKGDFS